MKHTDVQIYKRKLGRAGCWGRCLLLSVLLRPSCYPVDNQPFLLINCRGIWRLLPIKNWLGWVGPLSKQMKNLGAGVCEKAPQKPTGSQGLSGRGHREQSRGANLASLGERGVNSTLWAEQSHHPTQPTPVSLRWPWDLLQPQLLPLERTLETAWPRSSCVDMPQGPCQHATCPCSTAEGAGSGLGSQD